MGEVKAMKNFICMILFSGLCYRVVFCDQDCENAMSGKYENYADEVSSYDLTICSEKTHVRCGQEYAPALLENKPTMYVDVEDSCNLVTIIFFGNYTDSPNLLWLVYNIPASDLKKGFYGQSGCEEVSYNMPKDSSSETEHFFFVYCQDSEFDKFNCCTYEENEKVDVKKLSSDNNLKVVTAAHFFIVTAKEQLMNEKPNKDGICGRNPSE